MTTIHHATAKKAARNQVEMTVEGEMIIARDLQTNFILNGTNAVETLERMLQARADLADAGLTEEPEDEDAEVEPDAEEQEDEEPKRSGSVVREKYKEQYEPFDDSCGDEYAAAFAAAIKTDKGTVDMAMLASIAAQNGVDFSRWDHLNPGQRRMNLGNVLRGMVRRGEVIRIAGRVFGAPKLAAVA